MTLEQTKAFEAMAARIEQLERRSRRTRRLGLVGGLLVLPLLLLGAASLPKTVDGGRLVIRDAKGTARAEIALGKKDHNPKLTLADGRGKTRFLLALTGKAALPVITLFDAKGRMRSSFGLSPSGQSALRIIGPNKKVIRRLP